MLWLGSRYASAPHIPRKPSPPETFDRMAATWTDKLQNWQTDKHECDDQNGKDDTESFFRHGTSNGLAFKATSRE